VSNRAIFAGGVFTPSKTGPVRSAFQRPGFESINTYECIVIGMTQAPRTLTGLLRRFLSEAHGATAIEYALIAGIVSVAVVAGATGIGGGLSRGLQKAADGFRTP
jgi:pilus assembly protein Flp/PilA